MTGYAHSANGLGVNPKDAAKRLLRAPRREQGRRHHHGRGEGRQVAAAGDRSTTIDANSDGKLTADGTARRAIDSAPDDAAEPERSRR